MGIGLGTGVDDASDRTREGAARRRASENAAWPNALAPGCAGALEPFAGRDERRDVARRRPQKGPDRRSWIRGRAG